MANMSLKKNPMPSQDPNVRNKNFDEVALGYTEEQAALGLVQSLLLGVAQGHLQEIMIADIGVLRRHGILILTHIHSHVTLPPS